MALVIIAFFFDFNFLGVTVWKNGNKFLGKYLHGKREGHGRMIYMDRQSEYIGNWANNFYHGQGIIKDKYTEFRGEFNQGKKVRVDSIRSENDNFRSKLLKLNLRRCRIYIQPSDVFKIKFQALKKIIERTIHKI